MQFGLFLSKSIISEWGWQIFESLEKYTKILKGGYAALKDVTIIPPRKDNRMDTFFLVNAAFKKKRRFNSILNYNILGGNIEISLFTI